MFSLKKYVRDKIVRLVRFELEQINSVNNNIILIKDEVHNRDLIIGSLETQLVASKYWCHLFKYRYLALAEEHFGIDENFLKRRPVPNSIPDEMLDIFSMNGKINIEFSYEDESRPSNWPLIYRDQEIDHFLQMISNKQWFIYGMTDHWLWDAFSDYPIKSLSVAVMGSTTPWYESTCIYFGANPTTIEYNSIKVKSSRMRALSVSEFDKSPEVFDSAVSISSFEHDGLGRYGDPIDPVGDIKAMNKMKQIIRKGGLLYLAVPVGRDRLVFNSARIYGPIRFPYLIEGWTEVARYGFGPDCLDSEGSIQPVIVLRND
jgi:hypothetical protein